MKKLSFSITGMSCAACSAAIERGIARLPGVSLSNVNLPMNRLTVSFDESQVQEDTIISTVEKLGYGAQLMGTDNITLQIEGMTCASCAAAVERAVSKLEGVEEVSVNLATNTAKIKYTPGMVKLRDIRERIEKAGFHASLSETTDDYEQARIQKQQAYKKQKNKTIFAVLFAIPLFYISMGHMVGLPLPNAISPDYHPALYALLQMILVIPIMICGSKFYINGVKSAMHLSPNMDTLVAVGTGAAFIYSVASMISVFSGNHMAVHSLYFESAGVIIALILLGKTMESRSKGRASAAIFKLLELVPKKALIEENGEIHEISLKEVEAGDILVVRPGMSIPTDGVVLSGYTSIDESMLTGESIPIEKHENDKVYAGSMNKNGSIRFRATKVGTETTLGKIITLVEDAQGSKAPIARLADVIAGYFVPAVLGIALLAAIIWFIAGHSISFVLSVFIAVLVIACPCALGLATPMAIMVGTGRGAEMGVLIKSGEALETAHSTQVVVLDKTGTITKGQPEVTDILCREDLQENDLLRIAAAAESASEHPLGEAIVNQCKKLALDYPIDVPFEAFPGLGIQAQVQGKKILLGNEKLMRKHSISLETWKEKFNQLSQQGKTPVYLALDEKMAGIIAVADVVRESSKEAIRRLHDMNIEVVMLTGDNAVTAQAIANEVQIDRVISNVLPDEKADEIKKIQQSGKKTAMVGDGINDAPALTLADTGIAIGTGADVAIESADIVLIHDDLIDVANAINLSRKTIRNIRQNLFWAFAYNVLGIPVAAGLLYAFGGPLLSPMLAALAMSLSSVTVVGNALRLKNFKPYQN